MSTAAEWIEAYNEAFGRHMSNDELRREIARLEAELADARQTIEDLAIGTCEECQPNWKQPK